jgi:endonuclease YncB( thermonuclease family)
MLRTAALLALMAAALVALPAVTSDGRPTGVVRVIDGDTLDVGGTRVRLHGIDAVEAQQTCRTEQGVEWPCGAWVKAEVTRIYDGARANCATRDIDRYGRAVARCTVAGKDIGAALVSAGLATAYRLYSKDYVALETAAAKADRGLWAMQAQSPEAFRRAAPAPRSSAHVSSAPAGSPVVPASTSCAIKGNISSKGDRIYHVPGQRYYDKTKIEPGKGERWFCTATEARTAGWRASKV